jgi:hypothetical protein
MSGSTVCSVGAKNKWSTKEGDVNAFAEPKP